MFAFSFTLISRFENFYITTQHRLERVLSLTTSLVTPLNLVMVGAADSLNSFADDNKDISMDWTPLLVPAAPPLPVPMMLLLILCGAPLINEPFSDVPLFRDWARCFFKLAKVVPACDWSKFWVSRKKLFSPKREIFYRICECDRVCVCVVV